MKINYKTFSAEDARNLKAEAPAKLSVENTILWAISEFAKQKEDQILIEHKGNSICSITNRRYQTFISLNIGAWDLNKIINSLCKRGFKIGSSLGSISVSW
jgi:hypothetical protein